MHAAGVHVEITNLLVTGLNDSEEHVARLCQWMAENGLQEVPLHLSRYFPRYRMTSPGPTPKATLVRAREVATGQGIKQVYLGNV
jgi:pyruvate formate lyase activating enzyme